MLSGFHKKHELKYQGTAENVERSLKVLFAPQIQSFLITLFVQIHAYIDNPNNNNKSCTKESNSPTSLPQNMFYFILFYFIILVLWNWFKIMSEIPFTHSYKILTSAELCKLTVSIELCGEFIPMDGWALMMLFYPTNM